MQVPRAIIVHGLAMARFAVTAASDAGVAVTLLSAPGAGAYGGVGWWQALMALACPAGDVTHVLDCGQASGRALEAMRMGQRLLVLRADPRIWADLAQRAASCGGTLLASAPHALDLGLPGAEYRLPAWLARHNHEE